MIDIKEKCRIAAAAALNELIKSKNENADTIKPQEIVIQTPPDPALGDLGIPMFTYAKILRISPAEISQKCAALINDKKSEYGIEGLGDFSAAGTYLNLTLNKAESVFLILKCIKEQGKNYGSFNGSGKKPLAGQRIMLEYSSPNTNKPLHLGHLRNDALGESVSRILKKAGAEVFKVNIINNRGIHICKSMLAYKLFHEENNETPQSLGIKGDHFVGQCYVEFDKYSKEHPEADSQASELLVLWEKGDEEIRKLWQTMNDWTLDGIKKTYERTGVSFDKLYYESDTYLKGKEEIQKGLEQGIFFKAEDGSVRVDVSAATGSEKDKKEHEKILLRKDGTSVYITQDIGTAVSRFYDWQFNQMIYVVASEQIYHFKVLFFILKKLGFEWAEKLYHLSYGLVNLPSGRMKSREGTIVDADDLIDQLKAAAFEEMQKKERNEPDADMISEKIALAALHYYLLQVNPIKDMLFNPEESLSFNGNTGPYLQYMGARISSILKKAKENGITAVHSKETSNLLNAPEEWELIKELGNYPEYIHKAAVNSDPSIMAGYLYDLSKLFAKFYQQCPIISAEENILAGARLFLAECTLSVMKNAMELILVPYLERM